MFHLSSHKASWRGFASLDLPLNKRASLSSVIRLQLVAPFDSIVITWQRV